MSSLKFFLLMGLGSQLSGLAWGGDPSLQIPGLIEEVAIPGLATSNDIPVHLHAYLSSETLGRIEEYFLDAFLKAKLFVAPPNQQTQFEGMVQMTGLDVDAQISYTVLIQPSSNKTTTVIYGTSFLSPQYVLDKTLFAPIFLGATSVARSNLEGLRMISYRAKAKPADVLSFYKQALSTAGYRTQDSLSYVKDHDEIQVYVESKDSVMVSVSLSLKKLLQ